MNVLNQTLYLVSDGLLVPVIVALIFLFISSLMMLGGMWGIFVRRSKARKTWVPFIQRIRDSGIAPGDDELLGASGGAKDFDQCLKKLSRSRGAPIHLEKAVGDFELNARRDLDRTKILARTGPMLGLMGTLIPMGPALVGLASGNLESMGYNMRIAFSTTVIGVFIGAIGFFAHTVRQRWTLEDSGDLAYLSDVLGETERSGYAGTKIVSD